MCSSNIRETSRGSKGVKLVNLGDKDLLVGVSEVVELDEDDSEKDDSEISETNKSALSVSTDASINSSEETDQN